MTRKILTREEPGRNIQEFAWDDGIKKRFHFDSADIDLLESGGTLFRGETGFSLEEEPYDVESKFTQPADSMHVISPAKELKKTYRLELVLYELQGDNPEEPIKIDVIEEVVVIDCDTLEAGMDWLTKAGEQIIDGEQ
jgi:hypothetical protein